MKSADLDYIDLAFLKLRIKRMGWPAAFCLILPIIGIVGFIDYLLGPEPAFSIFYLIPLTIALFISGRTMGIVVSLLSAGSWLVADLLSGIAYSGPVLPIWNTSVRLAYFLLHTFLITWLLRTINEIRSLSLHDPLTHAANWRYFEDYAGKMTKTSLRKRSPLTLAYIDLDDFKKLNDTRGHTVGDEVLKTIASVIQKQIRPDDMLARLGGDEFALLLGTSAFSQAQEALKRVIGIVMKKIRKRKWEITLSVGAITFAKPPLSLGTMVREVDDLMYEVKRQGKKNIKHISRDSV